MLTPLAFELVILPLSEVEGEESPYLFLRIQPVSGLFLTVYFGQESC